MSEYKTTLIGIESAINIEGRSVFDKLNLPSGIDKNILKDSILMRSGEFEVLYSDPYLMTDLVGIWANKYYATFERWVKALQVKYDPLNNYDRYEDIEDTTKRNEKSNTKTDGSNKTKSEVDVTTDNDTDSTFSESAYNETDPSEKSIDHSENDVHTVTKSGGEGEDHSTTDGSRAEDGSYKRKAHLYGNIGVTTSQQMLESELNLGYWNIYNKITDMFITEFLLLVY